MYSHYLAMSSALSLANRIFTAFALFINLGFSLLELMSTNDKSYNPAF